MPVLADRIVLLIENTDLRKQLGDYAKNIVYQRFDYDVASGPVEKFLMEDMAKSSI